MDLDFLLSLVVPIDLFWGPTSKSPRRKNKECNIIITQMRALYRINSQIPSYYELCFKKVSPCSDGTSLGLGKWTHHLMTNKCNHVQHAEESKLHIVNLCWHIWMKVCQHTKDVKIVLPGDRLVSTTRRWTIRAWNQLPFLFFNIVPVKIAIHKRLQKQKLALLSEYQGRKSISFM